MLSVVVGGSFSLAALALILFAAHKMRAESFTARFWHFVIEIRWPVERGNDSGSHAQRP
jgi:hypothetical protein